MFFFRFPERYLCIIYKMKKLGIGFGTDAYTTTISGTYTSRAGTPSDPLAIMLSGKRVYAGVYGDFASEFTIPIGAMDVFQNAIYGRNERAGRWAQDHPVEAKNLRNFGSAIYFLQAGCPTDAKFYLDRVPELIGKDKMKEIASAIYAPESKPKPKPKTAPPGIQPGQYWYTVGATTNRRMW